MIIKDYMDTVGLRSTEASHELQSLSTDDKNKLLLSIADSIRSKNNEIIKANNEDIVLAKKSGLSEAMINRQMLDEIRIENIAKSVEENVRLRKVVINYILINYWRII